MFIFNNNLSIINIVSTLKKLNNTQKGRRKYNAIAKFIGQIIIIF
jgi:hypothetical protein